MNKAHFALRGTALALQQACSCGCACETLSGVVQFHGDRLACLTTIIVEEHSKAATINGLFLGFFLPVPGGTRKERATPSTSLRLSDIWEGSTAR
jgi:hypothetical protein